MRFVVACLCRDTLDVPGFQSVGQGDNMKLTSMELIECLDYLSRREDELVAELVRSENVPADSTLVEFTKEELKVVRDLKKLVETAEAW